MTTVAEPPVIHAPDGEEAPQPSGATGTPAPTASGTPPSRTTALLGRTYGGLRRATTIVPRSGRWRPSRDTVLVCALLAVVGCVYLPNITGFPGASDDEGTYLAQAWAVQHGVGLAHYTYWYDHPPLGWLQLAGVTWLP